MMTTPTLLVLVGAAIIGHTYAAPELAKHIAATRGATTSTGCANTPGDTTGKIKCLVVRFLGKCDQNAGAGCDATCQRCKSHSLIQARGHVHELLLSDHKGSKSKHYK
jgi:hypothetical protein